MTTFTLDTATSSFNLLNSQLKQITTKRKGVIVVDIVGP